MMTRRTTIPALAGRVGVVALLLLAGCQSKDQKALNQAKAQAISTNIPQQVQYINSKGQTVTKTVEPPLAKGQPAEVTTLITPPPLGTMPKSTNPVITPLPSVAQGSPSAPGYVGHAATPPTGPAAYPPTPPGTLSLPPGTEFLVRIDQHLSSRLSYAGERFYGNLQSPVVFNGAVVIPAGTPVAGRVIEARRGGRFRGRSVLDLRLTAMKLNGYEYPLPMHDDVFSVRGKGRRSAAIIGGMTGAGMLIGGLATGGVGLAIGAAAGAGSGTAVAATTDNHKVEIPSEAILRFRLADPLTLNTP
ncbi:MAG: hypothetical protein ACP5E5_11690 [Acidobacteriaceae bacterium]